MASDPTISAIVQLQGVSAPSDAGVDPEGAGSSAPDWPTVAKTKSYFTSAGFEVHAPLGTSFSIGAKRSHFESYFGQQLAVDEDDLLGVVTTADGGADLPLDPLPDDVRPAVKAVTFPPKPDLPGS